MPIIQIQPEKQVESCNQNKNLFFIVQQQGMIISVSLLSKGICSINLYNLKTPAK